MNKQALINKIKYMNENYIESNLTNYYGTVFITVKNNEFYLCLGNYNGPNGVKVSENFAEAYINEFLEKEHDLEELF